MDLENAILSQCDFIHQVITTDLKLDPDQLNYANVCGEVSGIITEEILDNRLPQQIDALHQDSFLLRSTIRKYMLIHRNEIRKRLQ